jgi:hypothetical protein
MSNKQISAPFQLFFEKIWENIVKIALFLSLYLSAFLYWAIRMRSLGFLIGVNPGIRLGGTVGYSKFGVLRRLPAENTPRSTLLWKAVSPDEVEEMMRIDHLKFPVILKPDTGLQSMGVRKIDTFAELKKYLLKVQRNLILQEFVKTEAEYAVLYYRLPGQTKGQIFSFAQRMRNSDGLAGTTCVSLNQLITKELENQFEVLSRHVDGFYFGRYDVLADSVADLESGNFKVVELNGANSMPLHLYDPLIPLSQRMKEFREYWRILYAISSQNESDGQAKNGTLGRYVYEMMSVMSAVVTV